MKMLVWFLLLSWDAVNLAESYTIYKQAQGNTTFRQVKTVTPDVLEYRDDAVTIGRFACYIVAAKVQAQRMPTYSSVSCAVNNQ